MAHPVVLQILLNEFKRGLFGIYDSGHCNSIATTSEAYHTGPERSRRKTAEDGGGGSASGSASAHGLRTTSRGKDDFYRCGTAARVQSPAACGRAVGAISVQNHTAHFDSTIALDNVTASVPAGVLTMIVGPPGSGKNSTHEVALLQVAVGFRYGMDSGRAGTSLAIQEERRLHVHLSGATRFGLSRRRPCGVLTGLELRDRRSSKCHVQIS